MSSLQLKAEKREKLGSLEAKRIRKSGKIPAVVHSKKGNLNITFDKKEFDVELYKGNLQTRVIEIELDGKKIKAITSRVELDPVCDQAIHVDLLDCSDSKKFKAWPKVAFSNREKSPGIRRGGFLNVRARKVEVLCASEALIPQTIEIDIAKLHVGDKIWSDAVTLPEGVEFSKRAKFLVASITGRGKSATEDAAAEGAEGAAKADGAKEGEGEKKEG